MKITNVIVRDIRFPTSLQQDGSDALNFVDPCIVRNARYAAPVRPGYSIDIRPDSIAEYEFPAGRFWTSSQGRTVEGGRP